MLKTAENATAHKAPIVDPIKITRPEPVRLDAETREWLRERIEEGYRLLMAEPSPIL